MDNQYLINMPVGLPILESLILDNKTFFKYEEGKEGKVIDFHTENVNKNHYYVKPFNSSGVLDMNYDFKGTYLPLPFVPQSCYDKICNKNIYNRLQSKFEIVIGIKQTIDTGNIIKSVLDRTNETFGQRIKFKCIKHYADFIESVPVMDFFIFFHKPSLEDEIMALLCQGHNIITFTTSYLTEKTKFVQDMSIIKEPINDTLLKLTKEKGYCLSVQNKQFEYAHTHLWNERVLNRLHNATI